MDELYEPEMCSIGKTRYTSKSQDRRKRIYTDNDPLAKKFEKTCQHTENSKFQCQKFTEHDIVENRKSFYRTHDKINQDIFLTGLIRVCEPLRRRQNMNLKPKTISSTLFLMKEGRLEIVCKQLFINALSISKRRLEFILKRIIAGELPYERRGGNRKPHNDPIQIDEHTEVENKSEMVLLCQQIDLNIKQELE